MIEDELNFVRDHKCSIIPCLDMKGIDCRICPIQELEEFIEKLVKEWVIIKQPI